MIIHFLTLLWSFLLTGTEQPNDIGLALYDNPVGQLAWIGEKFIICEFAYPQASLHCV